MSADKHRIIKITRLLQSRYHSGDLGNKTDPIEELIYIALSRQTHAKNVQASWSAIVSAGGPQSILEMKISRFAELIRAGGFSSQKAHWIKTALLRIKKVVGSLSLDHTRGWTNEQLESFLRSLPGINTKSAKCIMMYSLGRQVLPVDVHLRRICTRAGIVREGISERAIHQQLEKIVQPEYRYALHVNAIWHGRRICTALSPKCGTCIIRRFCSTGLLQAEA